MSEPELKINSVPIDLEICELLGSGSSDFIVLCFDGVQLDFFGTPYDSPDNRSARQYLVDSLNKKRSSLWRKMFNSWKPQICQQFGLPETTTAKDYRPVVSYKISRVCHGYSANLHCAITLFEKLADRIETWWALQSGSVCSVMVFTKDGKSFGRSGENTAFTIAETVLVMLKESKP